MRLGGKSSAEDVGAHAHHRAGVQHGVDARLAVVAHYQAAEPQARALPMFCSS